MGVEAILMGTAIGLGAAGSATAAAVGSKNQASANAANKEIAQMNNEFNERMMAKQMQYNSVEAQKSRDYSTQIYNSSVRNQWNMWNATNEYNSPSATRQRMEDAGYNPYMAAVGSGASMVSAPSAGSSGTASSGMASSAGNPQMQGYTPQLGGIGGAIESGLNLWNQIQNSRVGRDLSKSQISQLNIENQYKAQNLMAEIANKWSSAKNTEAKTMYQNQLNSVAGEMLNADLNLKQQTFENMRATFNSIQVQTALDNKVLNAFDQRFKLEVAQATSQIALQAAQRQLTSNQAVTELAKKIETIARTQGIKISNKVANGTADELIKQARLTTTQLRNNSGPNTPIQWMYAGSGTAMGYGYESSDGRKIYRPGWFH